MEEFRLDVVWAAEFLGNIWHRKSSVLPAPCYKSSENTLSLCPLSVTSAGVQLDTVFDNQQIRSPPFLCIPDNRSSGSGDYHPCRGFYDKFYHNMTDYLTVSVLQVSHNIWPITFGAQPNTSPRTSPNKKYLSANSPGASPKGIYF